jgi:hypothetical protein
MAARLSDILNPYSFTRKNVFACNLLTRKGHQIGNRF